MRRPNPALNRPAPRAEDRAPGFTRKKPLDLAEYPPPPALAARLVNNHNGYLRTYRLGECSVIVTKEHGRWHLSVANPNRLPSWDEVAAAWYRTVPGAAGVFGALVLPPLHEYVNVHEFCLQVKQIDDPDLSPGAPGEESNP